VSAESPRQTPERPKSARFERNSAQRWLVPAVFILILLGIVVTVGITVLAVLGLIPSA
jgi:hypothetical protein